MVGIVRDVADQRPPSFVLGKSFVGPADTEQCIGIVANGRGIERVLIEDRFVGGDLQVVASQLCVTLREQLADSRQQLLRAGYRPTVNFRFKILLDFFQRAAGHLPLPLSGQAIGVEKRDDGAITELCADVGQQRFQCGLFFVGQSGRRGGPSRFLADQHIGPVEPQLDRFLRSRFTERGFRLRELIDFIHPLLEDAHRGNHAPLQVARFPDRAEFHAGQHVVTVRDIGLQFQRLAQELPRLFEVRIGSAVGVQAVQRDEGREPQTVRVVRPQCQRLRALLLRSGHFHVPFFFGVVVGSHVSQPEFGRGQQCVRVVRIQIQHPAGRVARLVRILVAQQQFDQNTMGRDPMGVSVLIGIQRSLQQYLRAVGVGHGQLVDRLPLGVPEHDIRRLVVGLCFGLQRFQMAQGITDSANFRGDVDLQVADLRFELFVGLLFGLGCGRGRDVAEHALELEIGSAQVIRSWQLMGHLRDVHQQSAVLGARVEVGRLEGEEAAIVVGGRLERLGEIGWAGVRVSCFEFGGLVARECLLGGGQLQVRVRILQHLVSVREMDPDGR